VARRQLCERVSDNWAQGEAGNRRNGATSGRREVHGDGASEFEEERSEAFCIIEFDATKRDFASRKLRLGIAG
jgi:hypothetical protein